MFSKKCRISCDLFLHATHIFSLSYHNVLRIASLLEAQRKQALADIQSLKTKLHEGLDNPIGFVDILQRQVGV